MAQKLIVEGNDAIVLAVLCKKRGLPPPLGYETSLKFRDFVSAAGGYTNALNALKLAIQKPDDLTNIGIIVDANDVGAEARWQAIRSVLAQKYSPRTLEAADAQVGAKVIEEENLPKVGVWIMPDNSREGYLETFLADMVPLDEALWQHAVQQVAELRTQPFCELAAAKIGKANLHTWLAWKAEPGKPFGQALDSGYFHATAPTAQPFLDWFAATFQLSSATS